MTEPVPRAIADLLVLLRYKLDPISVDEVEDWLDHREWELALNLLADAIYVADVQLSTTEQDSMLHLMSEVGIPRERYVFLQLDAAT